MRKILCYTFVFELVTMKPMCGSKEIFENESVHKILEICLKNEIDDAGKTTELRCSIIKTSELCPLQLVNFD